MNRTPAQRAAMSRAKGAKFERDLAVALRPWFPDARRSRDNGFRSAVSSSPDTGDLDLGTPEFWVSAKNNHDGDTDSPSTLGKWFTECQTKAADLGRAGVLIQKRPNWSDPLDSWVWVTVNDLLAVVTGVPTRWGFDVPVRLSLRDWLTEAARTGHTVTDPDEKSSPESDSPAINSAGRAVPSADGVRPPGDELA